MPLLELHAATVRFGGNIAVDTVDLAVPAGEITGLIGPNGAGKTTTFNVITGLQPVSSGTVSFAGDDITKLKSHQRAQRGIARTFQRLESFGSMTVRENILVAAELNRRRLGEATDPEKLTSALMNRIGISQFADEIADSLPTGRARLVEIARALATNPRLLLLDEPASGLDEAESHELSSLLLSLAEGGLAILLVEHDVPLVMRVCSSIYVLDFGRILAHGNATEIQQSEAVQVAYLGQTGATA